MTRTALLLLSLLALSPATRADCAPLSKDDTPRASSVTHVQSQTLMTWDAGGPPSVRRLQLTDEPAGMQRRQTFALQTPADARHLRQTVPTPLQAAAENVSAPLFGSQFLLGDFMALPETATCTAEPEALIGDAMHQVQRWELPGAPPSHQIQRRFFRQDNQFLSRIDFLDQAGKVIRRLRFRSPGADDTGTWRARQITVDHLESGARSLIIVEAQTRYAQAPDFGHAPRKLRTP